MNTIVVDSSRIIIPVRNVTKRKKARAVVVEAGAAAAAAQRQHSGSTKPQQQTTHSRGSHPLPADRCTAPVVGLLPEAAQLGCSPGPEIAHIDSSLVGWLVGLTWWSGATGAANYPCVWVAVYLSFFARTPQEKSCCKQYPYKEPEDILGNVRGTKDQPTDRDIHALTRDFSTLTREKCHGSS